MRRPIVGFDRKIRLAWLDATADWTAEGLPAAHIRARLHRLLEGQVTGDGPHRARGKTVTVLIHVWTLVPDSLAALRDDALTLLRERHGRHRLALHWGMCVATYPFFHDVAAVTGRLLALQGTVALSQIARRTAESWGDRSTVIRSVQRVVRSFVEWGVLEETEDRGVFAAAPRIEVAGGDDAAPWLVEASIRAGEARSRRLRGLVTSPTFFPFGLELSARDLRRWPRLEVRRLGSDEEFVVVRERR